MYEEFFELQRRPFSATPDANCFVPLEAHQGVLDALAISCERGQGIGVLTGEAGLGKSLVGLRLAFELQPTFATAFLGHSAYATRRALLQAILFELNRPYDRKAEQELRLELAAALKSLRPEKQGFVLIVDEAHRLSVPLLDEVRLLTLLADGGEPLARVVLIGDHDLEERLADPELAAFNQRIGCQVDLAPLTQAESLEYLRANLEFAGGRADQLFTDEALAFLAKAADGVPRCLNHLADHALLLAFVTERRPVSIDVVREALDDLKQLPLHWNDPVSGGEIYRGLSQSPAMEDSAVDLWPQHETKSEDHPPESPSWEDSAFGESSAAIEIGGELDEEVTEPQETETVATEKITCLKEDWQAASQKTLSVEELLADVAELTKAVDSVTDRSDEEPHDSRPLCQVFAARESEFGAPSSQSFAVEEFAGDSQAAKAAELDEKLLEEALSLHDETEQAPWKPAADDGFTEPVWNLPERSWSADERPEIEFEEEPVIDRYVRIATDANGEGAVWNHHAPHTRATERRTVIATKTTRLVMATAGISDGADRTDGAHESDESHQSHELTDSDVDSGIVESYSRRPRDVEQASNQPIQASDHATEEDHGQVECLSDAKRDWHLPTELLKATLEDDGLEEQIGADVLDLYLDVQQSMLDRQIASRRPQISLKKPKAEELPQANAELDDVCQARAESDEFESLSRIEEDFQRAVEPPRATQPDAIQRAYGRLFSELRRRKR